MVNEFKIIVLGRNKINPIIGLNVIIEGLNSGSKNRVLFYAKNNTGYQNLLQISSIYSLEGIVALKDIKANKTGLIAVVISDESELFSAYSNNQVNAIGEFKEMLSSHFDESYLAISSNEDFNYELRKMFQFVVVPKVSYLDKDDYEIVEILSKILATEKSNMLGEDTSELFLKKDEVEKTFSNNKEAMNNSQKIADSCHVEIDFSKTYLPKYRLEKGVKSKDYLQALVFKGLDKRIRGLQVDRRKYLDRLHYELSVINEMGYNDYFLIVWDFVKYAKHKKYS